MDVRIICSVDNFRLALTTESFGNKTLASPKFENHKKTTSVCTDCLAYIPLYRECYGRFSIPELVQLHQC